MDEDLGTPGALAIIHDTVRAGNQALDDADTAQAASHRGALVAMLEVLGLNPDGPEWAHTTGVSTPAAEALDRVIHSVLERRAKARADKDFDLSDVLRDVVEQAGIAVEDGPDGSTWRIDG
jgi:cysteinyl-tRNA synthetase